MKGNQKESRRDRWMVEKDVYGGSWKGRKGRDGGCKVKKWKKKRKV